MAVMEGDPRQGAKLPLFGGSTGGLLSAAETEEKYVITWTGKPGQVFEMPTGGAAEMVEGKNFLTLARKEQCLALGAQLISDYKIKDYQIFRIPAGGEPVLVHPKDGVFPEKANEGRDTVGKVDHNIGKNKEPITYKFTSQKPWD
ncbi:MAG: photosystem I reaction center subunit II [Thermostichus sp. HHBFW_bins_43]